MSTRNKKASHGTDHHKMVIEAQDLRTFFWIASQFIIFAHEEPEVLGVLCEKNEEFMKGMMALASRFGALESAPIVGENREVDLGSIMAPLVAWCNTLMAAAQNAEGATEVSEEEYQQNKEAIRSIKVKRLEQKEE